MAVKAASASATRRRNVKPVTSIIKSDLTRDVDVSGIVDVPEDGQFVSVLGDTAFHTGAAIFNSRVAGVTATTVQAASLKMVWGSAMRSDLQAIPGGRRKTPVMPWIGEVEIETHLYAYDVGDLNAEYPIGALVSVELAPVAVQGSVARLILSPMENASTGWAVGQVTGYSAGAGPKAAGTQGSKVRVKLFNSPRKIA